MVGDIKLQISLFQHYKIPTLPLHSQQDSSAIVPFLFTEPNVLSIIVIPVP